MHGWLGTGLIFYSLLTYFSKKIGNFFQFVGICLAFRFRHIPNPKLRRNPSEFLWLPYLHNSLQIESTCIWQKIGIFVWKYWVLWTFCCSKRLVLGNNFYLENFCILIWWRAHLKMVNFGQILKFLSLFRSLEQYLPIDTEIWWILTRLWVILVIMTTMLTSKKKFVKS